MIIVKITGGLGNQMFQYSLGRALSIKLDCELVLDVTFYPSQELRKYELDKFNISARFATTEELIRVGAGESLISKVVHKLKLEPMIYPLYIKEKESMKYLKTIDKCIKGSYLDGYWQNPDYFKKYKDILLKDFTPVTNMSVIMNYWADKIKNSKSVSIHIRRGDYINNNQTNSVHGICSLEYYKKAIDVFDDNDDSISYYVFSDDIKWCKENLGFMKKCFFVDDTTDPVDDLMLMGLCEGNIIANSTFSWWGAWLGCSSGRTVAPINWFASKDKNANGIYPKSWITL